MGVFYGLVKMRNSLLLFCIILFAGCSHESGTYPEHSKENYFDISLKIPETGLPVLRIISADTIKSKSTWIASIIYMDSSFIQGQIKSRGNSTRGYPKKPYTFKLDNRTAFGDMPESKHWVLLANYRDRTLMRNAVSFEIARQTSLEWTPKGNFVELVLNNQWLGNYYLCEKIRFEKNRLNYKDAILLEFDSYFDQEFKFKSSRRELPVNIHEPEKMDSLKFSYIESYIDTIENILYGNYNYKISQYLDLGSFVDFFLVYELSLATETRMPKSSYMYKPENGKLKAGPVWDFDWSSFILPENDYLATRDGFRNKDALWYDALLKNAEFVDSLKAHWEKYQNRFETIFDFIDSTAQAIQTSNEENHKLWPMNLELFGSDLAGDEEMEFSESIDSIKRIYKQSIERVDSLIKAL